MPTPASLVSTGEVLTATQFNYLPRGVIDYKTSTATQNLGMAGDLTGLSITFTATSSRLYRISVYLPYIKQNTNASQNTYAIVDGSNNAKQSASLYMIATEIGSVVMELVETGLSGSVTRKARLTGIASGNTDINGNANYPTIMVVEDIGAA